MAKKPFPVLLADGYEHDIVAIKRVWIKYQIVNPLYIVKDGEECLDFLQQKGNYSPDIAPRPGISLLDIKIPKMDGLSVLQQIREDNELHSLPVIILTGSKCQEDRLRSKELGANAYIVKPVGSKDFSEAVRIIILYWESQVASITLPSIN